MAGTRIWRRGIRVSPRPQRSVGALLASLVIMLGAPTAGSRAAADALLPPVVSAPQPSNSLVPLAGAMWAEGVPAPAAPLDSKRVAFDSQGNAYVTDGVNRRVRKVSTSGTMTTFAGSGAQGDRGDGGPALAAAVAPGGVAVDSSGNVYVSDRAARRVRKIDTSGRITPFAGTGEDGSSGDGGQARSARLRGPEGLAVDSAGNVYIADPAANVVRKVAPSGVISTVAGSGSTSPLGDGGSATAAGLSNPNDVAVDGAGNLYIADTSHNRVRKVNSSGVITTVAGNGSTWPLGDGGPATSASLYSPLAVDVDAGGNVYIGDTRHNVVRKVNGAGVIATFAGTGVQQRSGDSGPAMSATLSWVTDVAVAPAGALWVSDDGRVRAVNAAGTISTAAGNGTYGTYGDGVLASSAMFQYPAGMAFDASGNLYVTDSHMVRRVGTDGMVAKIAGGADWGWTGDGGPAVQAKLTNPQGLALDAAGNLYVADTQNNRVRKVSPSGTITTVAGNGDWNFGGTGVSALATGFNHVNAVAVSPLTGELYLSTDGGVVARISATGVVTRVAESTSLGDVPDIKFDAAGNLFVADTYHNRVLKVSPSGAVSTFAGTGAYGSSGDGGAATAATLSYPNSLAVDPVGNIYISGLNSYRVRRVDTSGKIATVLGNGAYQPLSSTGPALGPVWPGVLAVDTMGALYASIQTMGRPAIVTAGHPVPAGGEIQPSETYGPNPSECLCQATAGDPVNTANGNFFEAFTDLRIPGRGFALGFARSYSSLAAGSTSAPGVLGYGWTHSYSMSLYEDTATGAVTVAQESGSTVAFARNGSSYKAPGRVLATMTKNGDGTFTFVRRKTDTFTFSAAGRLLAQTDGNGETTSLAYNAAGRLASVTDPAGRALSLSYDTAGRLASVADPGGRTVRYSYDQAGNLATVTDAGGGLTVFTYDAGHLILTVTRPNHGVVTNTYDSAGRVVAQVDPVGRRTAFSYAGDPYSAEGGSTTIALPGNEINVDTYIHGSLVARTRGLGTTDQGTWQFGYDPVTLRRAWAIDPTGALSLSTYDADGNLVSETDPLGRVTSHTYDALGNETSTTDAMGVTAESSYDSAGNLTSTSTAYVVGGALTEQQTTYVRSDAAHRGDVTEIIDPRGKSWSFTHDSKGNLTGEEDPLGNLTTFTYDVLGRRLTSVEARGNAPGAIPADYKTTYTYDAFGNVLTTTDPLGHRETRAYDPDGNLVSVTSADGHSTLRHFDPADQLVGVTRADGTTLSYTYDERGELANETDGLGRSTAYTYDNQGRRSRRVDPDARATTYAYDGAGRLVGTTEADGVSTRRTYDAAGQLTRIDYPNSQTPSVTFTYDPDGRRTAMTDGTGTTTYRWDPLHRPIGTTNGAGDSVSYQWDLGGHLVGLTYPGGSETVSRMYDDAGRMTAVTDWLSHTTAFDYDSSGNVIGTHYPNGTVATRTIDPGGRTSSIVHANGTGVLASFDYGRDAEGKVTSVQPVGMPDVAQTFTYTALNQLKTANLDAYAYDAADNITQYKSATTLAYDPSHQLQTATGGAGGSSTFSFDRRGNRTGSGPAAGSATRTYSYDAANRLTAFSGGTAGAYSYDGDGLRTSKTVDGATTSYAWDASSSLPLLIQEKIGTSATRYVYGPGGLVLESVDPTAAVTYYHQDALGSTRLLTDSTGAAVGTFAYDPFGQPIGATGSQTTPFGWAGEYRDAETGLVYLRARYYDPSTAQFVSSDPLSSMSGASYGYGFNDPLSNVDPTGLYAACGQIIDDDVWNSWSPDIQKLAETGACQQAPQGTWGSTGPSGVTETGDGMGSAPLGYMGPVPCRSVVCIVSNIVSPVPTSVAGATYTAGTTTYTLMRSNTLLDFLHGLVSGPLALVSGLSGFVAVGTGPTYYHEHNFPNKNCDTQAAGIPTVNGGTVFP